VKKIFNMFEMSVSSSTISKRLFHHSLPNSSVSQGVLELFLGLFKKKTPGFIETFDLDARPHVIMIPQQHISSA